MYYIQRAGLWDADNASLAGPNISEVGADEFKYAFIYSQDIITNSPSLDVDVDQTKIKYLFASHFDNWKTEKGRLTASNYIHDVLYTNFRTLEDPCDVLDLTRFPAAQITHAARPPINRDNWEEAFVYKMFTVFAIAGNDLMTFCQVANAAGPALPAAQPTFMSGYPAPGTPAVE